MSISIEAQTHMILKDLKRGEYISTLDALEKYGCFRLAARIYDLRCKGYPILTYIDTTPDGKRFALYKMNKRRS